MLRMCLHGSKTQEKRTILIGMRTSDLTIYCYQVNQVDCYPFMIAIDIRRVLELNLY